MTNPGGEPPNKPDRAAFEEWRAEVEDSIASVERHMHEFMCTTETTPTGAPQVDAALREFALVWGKRIAEYGDRTDEALANMAKAFEEASEGTGSPATGRPDGRGKPPNLGGASGDSDSPPPE